MKVVKKPMVSIEWLNAEFMHEESVRWLSGLKFIKDQECFFEDLTKLFRLQPIDSNIFSKSNETIGSLKVLSHKNQELINAVVVHEQKLKLLVDGKRQLKEVAAFKDRHGELFVLVKQYFKDCKTLKTKLFETFKAS